MKHGPTSRPWLAAFSIGCFLACSGKLNVGQGTDQPGAAAGSGSTPGGSAPGGSASGGSAAGGSASALGGSGGSSGKPPITKVGNAETCPAAIPTTGDSCELEGAACGYGPPPGSGDYSYNQCLCGERAEGDLRWDCLPIGTSYDSCPTSIENGSSCFGHYSTECWYPVSIRCTCSPDPGVWDCMKIGRPWEVPDPPSMPEPASPINTLTDADREAWCRWFQDTVSGPGFPPMPDSEVGPDGKTLSSSCAYAYGAACNVAVVTLSPRQCAQNLAVSQCAAPIGNLTDCVTTAYSECLPSPHGCARYMAYGCSGTIVADFGLQSAGGSAPTAGTTAAPTAGTGASSGGAMSGEEFSSPCSVQVE